MFEDRGGGSMKKYLKETVILVVQLFMFYIFPLFAGPTDVMGMVVMIILSTLILSAVLGVISDRKIKYLYPMIVAAVFVPSVFIHYNESALIHSVWYLVLATIGLTVGVIIHKLIRRVFMM